jgi:hypothetical protein
MSITYPLTLPAALDFSAFAMRLRRVVAVTASPFTGQQQVFRHPGAWWEAEATVPTIGDPTNARLWSAFLVSLRGRSGTFLMGDPSRRVPRGAAGAQAALTVVSAVVRGTSLTIGGFTPTQANALRAGDHIQIGTGANARLHLVVADVTADGAGEAVVPIEPPLRASHAGGTAVSLNAPAGVWRLTANDLGWSAEPGRFPSITLACVEAL